MITLQMQDGGFHISKHMFLGGNTQLADEGSFLPSFGFYCCSHCGCGLQLELAIFLLNNQIKIKTSTDKKIIITQTLPH